MDAARKEFNQEKVREEIKDKSKKLFGNIGKKFSKKGGGKTSARTESSLNSGGNNTNNTDQK